MTHTVLDPYTCHTREDLVRCLENYAVIRGRAKVQCIGDGGGEEVSDARYDAILRQNALVDRAMHKLRLMHHLSYVLLDAYYRCGLHEEHDGWAKALLRARLPHHPQTARERMLLENVFEGLLIAATDSLFTAVNVRS